MKLRDSYGIQLLSLFRYSDFRDASENTVRSILTGKHPKSEIPLLPMPDTVSVERTGELTSDVTLSWADCEFKYTFLWKKGGAENYVLDDMVPKE